MPAPDRYVLKGMFVILLVSGHREVGGVFAGFRVAPDSGRILAWSGH